MAREKKQLSYEFTQCQHTVNRQFSGQSSGALFFRIKSLAAVQAGYVFHLT